MKLPKRYNFKEVENFVRDKVIEHRFSKEEKILVIDTPPPYPAPFWHVAAALSYVIQDFIARSYRMLGYNVVYPCCFDGNGLPIEFYLEKYEKIPFGSLEREEYVRICRENLDRWRSKMEDIMKNLLLSMDYKNKYNTDNPEYRKLTQETFIELYKRGLIYEDLRPNNYCPKCKTTIADAEIEYKKVRGKLVYIKFETEIGKDIIIATTRPELLCACKAIIVHPEDQRYKEFHWKKAKVPLYNQEVQIIPNKQANPEFGTGAVMICSYGDWIDVKLFRELNLEPVKAIDEEGRMTEESKFLKGLKVKEAREKIIEILKEKGYLVKVEEIEHEVPVHERCETEVEIIPMKEYYLKQIEYLDELKKIIDEIKFVPEKYKNNLLNWVDSVTKDWPISRRRYYGTEIPIWKCKKCGYIYLPEPGKYYQPWKEKLEISCPKCGSRDWESETRVLDTWMDSSITILYVLKKYNLDINKVIKLRPQGYDIIRTWLYYTLLRVYQLKKTKAFDIVVINGMGLDKYGRRMSKRYGNVIYPEELISKYGADSLRLWLALEIEIGENYRINEDKIRGVSKFLNKLWNIARFISQFEPSEKPEKLYPADEWILEELKELENFVYENYKEFKFKEVAKRLYNFTWDIYASHYLELVKNRAYKNDPSARYTLYEALRRILKLWYPIIPAITYYLYEKIFNEDIRNEKIEYHKEVNKEIIELGRKVIEFNKKVWKIKEEKGLKLKDPISIEIPEELKIFEEDLKALHNIQ